ncbi:MAG: protein kinase [Bacteroidales bacterium]|nr:protein kinase [Bacteroidales bacterium]
MTPFPDDAPIWDMLAQWEQAAQQGRELTPEELSRDHPEWLPDLQEAIARLRATAWLNPPVTAQEPDAVAAPTNIGPYEFLTLVGSGGMGQVYKARHRFMHRLVAIKLLTQHRRMDPVQRERCTAEVRATARLTHPHVVHAYDAGEQDGVPYLVMEYIEGLNLRDLVARDGPLPVSTAIAYTRQAVLGLGFAHRMGIVHRDVKPSNWLLTVDGTVKVADFGLAAFSGTPHATDAATNTATIVGTVDCIAPEQILGHAQVDHRADIYALGCTLFTLLTGHPLFRGTIPEILQSHQSHTPPSLREMRPDVPPALDQLFTRLVAKKPADRPPSMEAVLESLDAILSSRRRSWWPFFLALGGLSAVSFLGYPIIWGTWPLATSPAEPPPSTITPAPSPPPTVSSVSPLSHPTSPLPLRPMILPGAEGSRRLNDWKSWTMQKGKWTQTAEEIVGTGESILQCGYRLPGQLVWECEVRVLEGMRPRIRFGGTRFWVGNEGYSQRFGLHSPREEEIRGQPVPYRIGEQLAIRVEFRADTVLLWVNGQQTQSARYTPVPFLYVSLEGGDGWSPGTTAFRSLRVSAPRP